MSELSKANTKIKRHEEYKTHSVAIVTRCLMSIRSPNLLYSFFFLNLISAVNTNLETKLYRRGSYSVWLIRSKGTNSLLLDWSACILFLIVVFDIFNLLFLADLIFYLHSTLRYTQVDNAFNDSFSFVIWWDAQKQKVSKWNNIRRYEHQVYINAGLSLH